MNTTTVILNDRNHGKIELTLRDGIVVGACGGEPRRFIGLTEAAARHMARFGGTPENAKAKTATSTPATPVVAATVTLIVTNIGDADYGEDDWVVEVDCNDKTVIDSAYKALNARFTLSRHGNVVVTAPTAEQLRSVVDGYAEDDDGTYGFHVDITRAAETAMRAAR